MSEGQIIGHDDAQDLPEPREERLTREEREKLCSEEMRKILERYECQIVFKGTPQITKVERVGDAGSKIQVEAGIDRYEFGVQAVSSSR